MSEPSDSAASSPDTEDVTPAKPGPIRRLYDWVLSWAESPYGTLALFLLAVAESSFFPIPPDVLLIALGVAIPANAFRYAAVCTLGSVIGGVIGYYLGFAMWASVEPLVIPTLFSAEKFAKVTGLYAEWDVWIVFTAGFTPIPYKLFTIAGGVAKINLAAFIATSLVGRASRFFLVALVIRRYGDLARDLIDRYFNLVTLAFTILLIGAFLLLKVVLH